MSNHGPPVVGHNLPFSIKSPRLMAVGFTLYLGSAMALPFFTLRKQLKRMYNVNSDVGVPQRSKPFGSISFRGRSPDSAESIIKEVETMMTEDLDTMLLPDLHGKSDILEERHIRELSKFLPARAEGYSWTLAFSTTTMGFNLKSLYRSLSRYEGPVLLIIKDNQGSVFGAFSSCSLRPSESFYGTGETYLFTFKQSGAPLLVSGPSSVQLGGGPTQTSTIKSNINNQPINSNNNNNINNNNSPLPARQNFRRYSWTGDNLYFIKGGADSLAFGAGEGNFGLWLDEDLYHGTTQSCLTFKNEPLANQEDFVVCALECWCFL